MGGGGGGEGRKTCKNLVFQFLNFPCIMEGRGGEGGWKKERKKKVVKEKKTGKENRERENKKGWGKQSRPEF